MVLGNPRDPGGRERQQRLHKVTSPPASRGKWQMQTSSGAGPVLELLLLPVLLLLELLLLPVLLLELLPVLLLLLLT